jgi:hypothetical protein
MSDRQNVQASGESAAQADAFGDKIVSAETKLDTGGGNSVRVKL